MEAQKVSDPSQKFKIALFSLFFIVAIVGYFHLVGVVRESKTVLAGIDNIDLRTATANVVHGTAICGSSSSIPIAPLSGRNWIRISNGATSTVFIGLNVNNTSTESLTAGTGIRLDAVGLVGSPQTSSTFSGQNYFDSGESGINWVAAFSCVGNASGSVINYIQTN